MRTGAQAAHCLRSRLRKRRCAYMAIAAFIFMWTAMIMIYGYSRGSLRHVTRSLSPPLPPVAGNMTAQMLEIRAAASAAWRAYAATGMTGDDVRPLAGGAESSLRVRASLYDSLGTLFVMGLREEYEQAVAEVLRLGAPRTFIYQTSSFEYNIRVVGGLLSAAQLSGDRRLLVVAEEAAHTLLSSSYLLWPSPLPIGRVRMQPLTPLNFPVWLIARVMDVSWYLFERVFIGPQYCKLARIGSYSLELRALTLATGNKHYACTADAIQAHIMADAVHAPWPLGPEFHEGATGLHLSWDTLTGVGVTLPNGTVGNPSLGTGYDSFWEYLLKSHLMMPNDAPELYGGVYRKLAQQLAHEAQSSDSMQFIYTHANLLFLSHMASHRLHEHLGCYVPGLLMLGAHKLADRQGTYDMDTGLRLLDGCLWTYEDESVSSTGLGGEWLSMWRGAIDGNFEYLLRPETAESVFIAWRVTGDPRYREAAWRMFSAIKKLQVEWSGGFHGLQDVRKGFARAASAERAAESRGVVDLQPSYFIAETLK